MIYHLLIDFIVIEVCCCSGVATVGPGRPRVVDIYITQYGSTVYIRISMVYISPLKTIYKHFVHFHFQFELDFTFNDIKVKNM